MIHCKANVAEAQARYIWRDVGSISHRDYPHSLEHRCDEYDDYKEHSGPKKSPTDGSPAACGENLRMEGLPLLEFRSLDFRKNKIPRDLQQQARQAPYCIGKKK